MLELTNADWSLGGRTTDIATCLKRTETPPPDGWNEATRRRT